MRQKFSYYEALTSLKNSEFSKERKIRSIESLLTKIEDIDIKIAIIISKRNVNIIQDNFMNLSCEGKFSVSRMWILKRKLNLDKNSIPIAKFDKSRNLITNYQGLLELYRET